ncbi:MAG: M3 family metallopeptidase [Propionibacterium sp.]|nr:M3 family metallopeptidase [Propionibacterium sp.]
MIDPTNPLAHPSTLPLGLPDYAAITPAHIEEAMREGMAQQRREWEAVATDPADPTVENTVVALDRSGSLLERAATVMWTMASSVGGQDYDALQETFSPLLAAHASAFTLDVRLYERFRALARQDLDEETAWVVARQVRQFERLGVALEAADQERLRELDQRLAAAEADVEIRISRQLERTGLPGEEADGLEGLDADTRAHYEAFGAQRGTRWFIPCRNFSTQLDQAVLRHPSVRRGLLEVSQTRGTGEDPQTDTRPRVLEIVALRAERAQLLGFPDHASLVMEAETIPGPATARDLLVTVGSSALEQVATDASQLRELASADPLGDGLQAADWPYYEDRLRHRTLGVDAEALRPYLVLDRVIEDGVFLAANRLYGLTMVARPDLRGWSEDTRVWEVHDQDGTLLGLFLGDWFARPGKKGGAWMHEVVTPSRGESVLPVVGNNANFQRPADGGPAHLTWDEVETCFHEFGHALHALLSATGYRRDAGTNVPRDFVELPSQLNEMWAFHPEVLAHYARHVDTGEPLPAQWVEAISRSKTFGQGFATLEYVEAALIDQAWHRLTPRQVPEGEDCVRDFETEALEGYGVHSDLVPPRYRSTYFAHTFAGGYDAGYYSYMWAEVLVAELEGWFRTVAAHDGDGGLNREAGEILRRELLSRGDSRDPLESFCAVVGHDADPASVLVRRGLPRGA